MVHGLSPGPANRSNPRATARPQPSQCTRLPVHPRPSRTPIELTSAGRDDRWHACPNKTQSFYDFVSHFLLWWTQSFCYIELGHSVNHFATINSIILWFYQPFCYGELNHFAAIISHFMILSGILLQWTQSFAAMNSVILLIWTQPFCYNELNHFTTMLSYFMILSVIFLR
jgi:hypothetical protein